MIIITTKKKIIIDANASNTLGKEIKQQAVNQAPAAFISQLNISPNPVQKGNSFTVSFTAKHTGNYMLQILNEAGAVIQLQKIIVKAKDNAIQLTANTNWASGIYYVNISDPLNNMVNTAKFIVQ